MSGNALQINAVSTSTADGGGSEGLIAAFTPSGIVESGYNYGFEDGFIEMGAGTPGSLPFRADEHGNVTVNSTKVAGGTIIAPAFGNGTAATLSDTSRDYMVYLACTTAGHGVTLAIGPTSTPSGTLISNAGTVAVGSLYTVGLPAAWYLEWSATWAGYQPVGR